MFARSRQPQVIYVQESERPPSWTWSIYTLLRYGTRKHRIVVLTILAAIFLAVFGGLIALGIASHQVTGG